MPAGLAFREGKAGTGFEDSNPFLIHTVKSGSKDNFIFNTTQKHIEWRESLYSKTIKPIYQKYGGKIGYNIKKVSNYQTTPSEVAIPYEKWPSYISQKKKYIVSSTAKWRFTDAELIQLRAIKCPHEVWISTLNYQRLGYKYIRKPRLLASVDVDSLKTLTPNVAKFLKEHPRFMGLQRK